MAQDQIVSHAGYYLVPLSYYNYDERASRSYNNSFKQERIISSPCEIELTEDQLYYLLVQFTLKRDQLFSHGYPEMNEDKEVRILKPYFPTPYQVPKLNKTCENIDVVGSSNSSAYFSNKTIGMERTCVRCNAGFLINEEEYLTKERCFHHWGQLLNHHIYSCCKRIVGAVGCSTAKYHVWSGTVSGVNERLQGFVKTQVSSMNMRRKVYALDCEMCYTVKGLEVCKVSLLAFNATIVYEHFVKPEHEVVDYNTRYSGVTESDVNSANSKTFSEMQTDFLKLINEDTILLGHALENDLRVLKLLHNKVVDTSLVFPHERGYPYRYSLKTLMLRLLNKQIQTSDSGHSSHEDCLSCLELIFCKLQDHYGTGNIKLISNIGF